MKWQKGRDRDGNIMNRVSVSDQGYKIAIYTVAGVDKFRASFQGEFIHLPVIDQHEAVKACKAHSANR